MTDSLMIVIINFDLSNRYIITISREIALRHGCSPVHLLYIFRTPVPKNAWMTASQNTFNYERCNSLQHTVVRFQREEISPECYKNI